MIFSAPSSSHASGLRTTQIKLAGVAETKEIRPLDDPAGIDVQAGNDALELTHLRAASIASVTVNRPS